MRIYSKTIKLGNILLYFFSVVSLIAQNPGGVKRAKLWAKFKPQEMHSNYQREIFNYYPYSDKLFKSLSIDNNDEERRISLFLVYKQNSNSYTIARIEANNLDLSLNDTSLIANQSIKFRYQNDKPKILSFIGKPASIQGKLSKSSFYFGSDNSDHLVSDLIAECIYFDKIISILQRKKIESYLALKYGIPLVDTADYYASNGDIVWNHKHSPEFNNNIFAIARDDASGLYNKQSKSVYSDFNMSLSLGGLSDFNEKNSVGLKNQVFLFCSDNNGELNFSNVKDKWNTKIMNRIWQLSDIKNKLSNKTITIHCDPVAFDVTSDNFVVIGNDLNQLSQCKMHKLSVNNDGKYSAEISFDEDGSGKDYFSFINVKNSNVNIQIDSLHCDDSKIKVQINITDSNADAKFILKQTENHSNNILSQSLTNKNDLYLTYGSYQMESYIGSSLLNKYPFILSKSECKIEIPAREFSISPNLAEINQEISIQVKNTKQQTTIAIYNPYGSLISTIKLAASDAVQKEVIKLSTAGIFLVEFNYDGKSETHKLIIQ